MAHSSVRPDAVLCPLVLEGTWRNQLGSRLAVQVDGRGGLHGTYHSEAGLAPEAIYRVSGSYDPAPSASTVVVGFVVDWPETHSVTVWSGVYDGSDDTIKATWLMTAEREPAEEWRSTLVGHDVFRRQTLV